MDVVLVFAQYTSLIIEKLLQTSAIPKDTARIAGLAHFSKILVFSNVELSLIQHFCCALMTLR